MVTKTVGKPSLGSSQLSMSFDKERQRWIYGCGACYKLSSHELAISKGPFYVSRNDERAWAHKKISLCDEPNLYAMRDEL